MPFHSWFVEDEFPMFSTKDGPNRPFQTAIQNLQSAAAVAMINIPLSVGVAVASNVHPMVGIMTSVWGGLFYSIFSSSHFNVAGASVAISAVLNVAVVRFGSGIVPYIAMFAGLWTIVIRLIRIDRFLLHMPRTVVLGFSAGVAVMIILSMLPFATGNGYDFDRKETQWSQTITLEQFFE